MGVTTVVVGAVGVVGAVVITEVVPGVVPLPMVVVIGPFSM